MSHLRYLASVTHPPEAPLQCIRASGSVVEARGPRVLGPARCIQLQCQ
jgi:hypothetical protein